MKTGKRGIGQKRYKVFIFINDTEILCAFAVEHIAHEAGVMLVEIILSDRETCLYLPGNNRRSDEL